MQRCSSLFISGNTFHLTIYLKYFHLSESIRVYPYMPLSSAQRILASLSILKKSAPQDSISLIWNIEPPVLASSVITPHQHHLSQHQRHHNHHHLYQLSQFSTLISKQNRAWDIFLPGGQARRGRWGRHILYCWRLDQSRASPDPIPAGWAPPYGARLQDEGEGHVLQVLPSTELTSHIYRGGSGRY